MKWEFIAAACLAFTTGCAILQNENAPRIAAVRAEGKVIVDGDASELFWQDAPAYPLLVPEDQPGSPECAQKGWIRFARDDRFLYLYAEVVDDDVVQEENADYGNLYETGDVISTYVYRQGIENKNFSYSAAVGLFYSAVGFVFVVGSNALSRKVTGSSLW